MEFYKVIMDETVVPVERCTFTTNSLIMVNDIKIYFIYEICGLSLVIDKIFYFVFINMPYYNGYNGI